jgi:hypothetical protein
MAQTRDHGRLLVGLLDSWTGRRFRHLGDGREGILVKAKRGFAIEYELRGEVLEEPVNQSKLMSDWTDELGPSRRLLEEEIQKVADYADRMLQACVRHEPYLFHEIPLSGHEVFDREFHKQVREFLREKYND